MSDKSKEGVVDSYIGMDDFVKIYTPVRYGLKKLKFTDDDANRYAWFCQAIYKELKDQHDVIDSLQRIARANKLLPQAIEMNLVRSAGTLKNYRLSAGVGVVAPFIDRLSALAKANGIQLNECSLSVTKVAMDVAGAGTGAVTFGTGMGTVLLFLSVVATFNDGQSLGKACFQ